MKDNFSRLAGMVVIFFLLLFACAGLKETGKPSGQRQEVTVVISIKNAPNSVRAFGMDLFYPEDVLTFKHLERGSLLQNGFGMFGGNVIAPGRLRIGGVEPGEASLPGGANGELVRLTFDADQVNASDFQLNYLRSDFRDWLTGGNQHLVITVMDH